MLLVQNFLENYTFKDLQDQHGVYASLSKDKKKISLNYDQIETKENDVLSLDCRGIILCKSDYSDFATVGDDKLDLSVIVGKTKILAFGMRRFFNYGQGAAAEINWHDPNLSILEKLDGTLCLIWYNPFTNKWNVATRSKSDADLLMDNGLFTFRTLFEKALYNTCGLSFDEYTSKLNQKITYCFELTSPYNKVVVDYKDNGVTLIAAREIIYKENTLECISLNELDVFKVNTYGVPYARVYPTKSISEIVEWVSGLNPVEHEGVIIVDSNFNRIKVKNAQYVAYSKIKDTLGKSIRSCLELILLEKDDDVLAFMPEDIINNMLDMKSKLKSLINEYNNIYNSLKSESDAIHKDDKKTFALLLKNNKIVWTAPLFQIFDNKALNIHDYINKNKMYNGSWSNSFLDKILELLNKV